MGIIGSYGSQQAEIDELKRTLLSCAGTHRRKDGGGFGAVPLKEGDNDDDADAGDRLVCVTGGVSFLGLAIVNRLLNCGYSVRVIVANEEDVGKLRDMEVSGEMRGTNNNNIMSAVVANFSDMESLSQAFSGCRGVFHTAALVDPHGLSGYSKSMVDIEVKACENVMEACARTPSVRRCVLTSSLLACIWRDHSTIQLSSTIDHSCWSDESICIEKQLWCALGKLRAEKAAWRVAEKRDFKLGTLCPGLITGPRFYLRNPVASIAYFKGAQEMYATRLLATIDVHKLAEAHVDVYEAMDKAAPGRYICFDHVIESEDELENLARELGMQLRSIFVGNGLGDSSYRFELSNSKLPKPVARTSCRTV